MSTPIYRTLVRAKTFINPLLITPEEQKREPTGKLPTHVTNYFRANPTARTFTEDRQEAVDRLLDDRSFDNNFTLDRVEYIRSEEQDLAVVYYTDSKRSR